MHSFVMLLLGMFEDPHWAACHFRGLPNERLHGSREGLVLDGLRPNLSKGRCGSRVAHPPVHINTLAVKQDALRQVRIQRGATLDGSACC